MVKQTTDNLSFFLDIFLDQRQVDRPTMDDQVHAAANYGAFSRV